MRFDTRAVERPTQRMRNGKKEAGLARHDLDDILLKRSALAEQL